MPYNCKNGLNWAWKPLNKVSVIDADSQSSPSNLLPTPTSICSVQKHLEPLSRIFWSLSPPWIFWHTAACWKTQILPKCVLPEWDQAIADIFVKASFGTEPVTASIAFHSIRADLSNPSKRVNVPWQCIHANEMPGKKTEETSARGNEKRLRWRNTPTYLQEISIKTANPHSGSSSDTLQKSHHSQTQLWTTRLATGLIFKIHSDYAVSFPPVAIEEHWRQMERIGVQVKAEREALRASEKQTFLGHLTLRRWVIGPLDIHDKKVGNAQGVECSLSRNISALTVSPKHLCSTFVSSVALGMAASTTWVQSEIF